MTKAIGRDSELHRDERLVLSSWPEEPRTMAQDVLDDVAAADQRKEFVNDHPLIVPAKQLLGRQEHRVLQVLGGRVGLGRRAEHVIESTCDQAIDNGVVAFQKRELELRHQHVLIVSRIADQCGALCRAGEVSGAD
jgi:hypothetical protein